MFECVWLEIVPLCVRESKESKSILNPSLIPIETQPQQKVKYEKLFCGLIKTVKFPKQ